MDMDYKAMWEALREKVERAHAFYVDGIYCSLHEATDGMVHTENMLQAMDTLESMYRKKDTSAVYEVEQINAQFVKPGVPTYKVINAP